tara:strand:+ start:4691 stop:5218 length:528 start_codon:yes stop_codon:yes gene_type:complete
MEDYIKELEKSNQVLSDQLERVTSAREDWSTQSRSVKGVATALAKAQPDWSGGVIETGRNPHYKRADGTPSSFQQLCDMVAKAGPILAKNGLAVTQVTVPKETSAGVRIFLVTTVMHGATDSWIRSYWPMAPERKGQQALASEHTYSKRQGYGGVLVIPPAEDDDGEASEGRGNA